MKLGYPTINWTIGCKGDKTFRIKSYSNEKLIETADNNLKCLFEVLKFNIQHNLLFFRITSLLIPFASHSIMSFDWKEHYKDYFKKIGDLIQKNGIRISMHPRQFVVMNSKDSEVFKRSLKELEYHTDVLELLRLDNTAKIQIHPCGAYGNKEKSIERFAERFETLDERLKNRMILENEDKNYNLLDCLKISSKTNIPIIFDTFHHEVLNNGENFNECLTEVRQTWKNKDGIPMIDYSSQALEEVIGKHAKSIDLENFKNFIEKSKPFDFDIILEIKDKEASALKAVEVLKDDSRFIKI